jgi:hypothetical protein
MRQIAILVGAPYPFGFWADWGGTNDEDMIIDEHNLEVLIDFRSELLSWFRETWRTYEDLERIKIPIEYMLGGWTIQLFAKKVGEIIGFINFVELHKDEPNLAIEFR